MNKIENSNILVTGGAGFVGSYVVEQLLTHNPRKIYIIDNLLRGSHKNMENFLHNPIVEFYEKDIRDYAFLETLIRQSDFIFHLAALRITRCAEPNNQVEAFSVMFDATFKIIDLARKHNIKKVIYSSSASVYGLAQHFPTPETDNPYDNSTFYGAAKLSGEQMLRSYFDMYGLNYVALRYFNIYGPRMDREGKYTEVMIKWMDCIRDGQNPKIFGDGSTSMDFVYVEDVAKANIQALLSDCTNHVFNIGCERKTSLAELLEILLKLSGSDLKPEYHPERIVNPVQRRLADITKAKTLLGFTPAYGLEEGLKNLIKWHSGK